MWIATRWFAPNALQKMAQQEGIAGIYLPFWTYAADTESQYSGARGVHYWETEYFTTQDSNGNQVQQSRQVMRTAWYGASGQVARKFSDVLVPATKSVNEQRLDALGTVGSAFIVRVRTGVPGGVQGAAVSDRIAGRV